MAPIEKYYTREGKNDKAQALLSDLLYGSSPNDRGWLRRLSEDVSGGHGRTWAEGTLPIPFPFQPPFYVLVHAIGRDVMYIQVLALCLEALRQLHTDILSQTAPPSPTPAPGLGP